MTTTPSQTVGPFFHYALPYEGGDTPARDGAAGERIELVGMVLDGDGAPVADALVEIWQADAAGLYAHPEDGRDGARDPNFTGFGRVAVDGEGRFCFRTVKPGPVPGPGNAPQAPHIDVSIFARGLLDRLVTRVYFEGEPANDADPVLACVPEHRRGTLLARPEAPGVWRWTVVLQGEDETVFFDA